MNEKKNSNVILILAILCSILTGVLCFQFNKIPQTIEKRDTTIIRDTVWRDTTIIEKQLVPKEVIKKKVDTVFTPSGDSILLVTEKKTFEKSLTMGLDTADVQVTTQGINTSLESLKMRLRLHQVNTQEIVQITKYVEKKKRIGIGPTVTFGYDPLRKEWGCLIGVGVTLNF